MWTRGFLLALCLALGACASAPRPALDRTRSGQIALDLSPDQPSTAAKRAAFWCLADSYQSVAESATDDEIRRMAAQAAERYERAAPNAQERDDAGWRAGERIIVGLADGGTCTTTVR